MPVGQAAEVSLQIEDTGGLGSFPMEIRAVPSDMEGENTVVSIDGLEPGVPSRREVRVDPGGTTELNVSVRFADLEPFRTFDLIFVSDPGTDEEQILQSVGLLNMQSTVESDADAPTRLRLFDPQICSGN